MHSIEKIQWEEDWRIAGHVLVLDEARIRGSGAGMDPPDGARLEEGVWHYRVSRELAALELAHSPYTPGYSLCADGTCQPLAGYLEGLPRSRPSTSRPATDAATRPIADRGFGAGAQRKEARKFAPLCGPRMCRAGRHPEP